MGRELTDVVFRGDTDDVVAKFTVATKLRIDGIGSSTQVGFVHADEAFYTRSLRGDEAAVDEQVIIARHG